MLRFKTVSSKRWGKHLKTRTNAEFPLLHGRQCLPLPVSLVAPVTVLLTGMLYLAGWIYRTTLVDHFGLSSSMFEISLQDTLALGYPLVVFGTAFAAAIIYLLWTLHQSLVKNRPASSRPWVQRVSSFTERLNRANGILTSVMILLMYGALAGWLIGRLEAVSIVKSVEGGCKERCFSYVVGDTIHTGRLVAQDKTRAAVYTKAGLVLFKTDELARVLPRFPLAQEPILRE